MKEEITEIIENLLNESPMLADAEAEFKRMIGEDSDLRRNYREWCHEVGSTEKRGFYDYAEEYLDSQDDVWNTLTDIDE